MNIPETVVDDYGKEQAAIMGQAQTELRRYAELLNWSGDYSELIANRDAMAEAMEQIVRRNGSAAAANAAELWESLWEAFTGQFRPAKVKADTDISAITETVHFAAGSLFPGDGQPPNVDAFLSRLDSTVVRMVNQQAMDTMVANHMPGTKYRRVTNGSKVCKLCKELEGRGYVWDVDDLVKPHDGCMCTLMPGFGEKPKITKPRREKARQQTERRTERRNAEKAATPSATATRTEYVTPDDFSGGLNDMVAYIEGAESIEQLESRAAALEAMLRKGYGSSFVQNAARAISRAIKAKKQELS